MTKLDDCKIKWRKKKLESDASIEEFNKSFDKVSATQRYFGYEPPKSRWILVHDYCPCCDSRLLSYSRVASKTVFECPNCGYEYAKQYFTVY